MKRLAILAFLMTSCRATPPRAARLSAPIPGFPSSIVGGNDAQGNAHVYGVDPTNGAMLMELVGFSATGFRVPGTPSSVIGGNDAQGNAHVFGTDPDSGALLVELVNAPLPDSESCT